MHIEGSVPAVMQPPRLVTYPLWKWTWKSCKTEVAVVLVPGVLFFSQQNPCGSACCEAPYERWGRVSTGDCRSRVLPIQGVWIDFGWTILDACPENMLGFGPNWTLLKRKEDCLFLLNVLIFLMENCKSTTSLWWKYVQCFPVPGFEALCMFSWF